MSDGGDEAGSTGGAAGAAGDALIATLVLLGMVVLVALSNDAREKALAAERHAYDVALLTRSVGSSMPRAPKPRSAASCSTKKRRRPATSITASGAWPATRSTS